MIVITSVGAFFEARAFVAFGPNPNADIAVVRAAWREDALRLLRVALTGLPEMLAELDRFEERSAALRNVSTVATPVPTAPQSVETAVDDAPVAGLSAPQTAALIQYAATNGRRWKSKLLATWESGRVENPELQQIRNIIGPSGLDRFRFQESRKIAESAKSRLTLTP